MNRRGFLAALAGAAVDPERLVWTPGKLISIPKTLRVIPPCPFRIYAAFGGNEDVAAVMNGLMRYRWRTDATFRAQVENAWALSDSLLIDDIARSELRDVQAGTGYFRGLVRATVRS